MTLLLVFLAIAVLGVAAAFSSGRLRSASAEQDSGVRGPAEVQGLAEPDPRLPPVLLPQDPGADDISRLRLSVAPRGYRMDQVDAVLERLARALAEKDARIGRLEAERRGHGQDAEPDGESA
ncbi:DivIVA domain-containing protein [Arthrobacter sp. YD2]|uniref:DivIVA domain-containing protein n=1 Tax=Arthrobacter sp. YD2 TaxID=3058046 RepID=UPI0025B4B38C|nr:DivIVA domain-containing protein [Arthrobacter sp. YD2]MDN3903900.1 DivIVA domain-containing protein [Arthrobacter sp. YD2]